MLQHVDGLSALRFVALTAAQDVSSEESPRLITAIALRTEVIASIKGGHNLDLKTFHVTITEATLKNVSAELLRKCISFMLWNDPVCQKRGFVLDIWNTGPGTCINHPKDVKRLCSNISYNVSSKSFTIQESENLMLDVLIELVVLFEKYIFYAKLFRRRMRRFLTSDSSVVSDTLKLHRISYPRQVRQLIF